MPSSRVKLELNVYTFRSVDSEVKTRCTGCKKKTWSILKRYCARHTQGRMLIDVANERSCTKVFETVFMLNLSFETKKLWLKI